MLTQLFLNNLYGLLMLKKCKFNKSPKMKIK